MPIGLCARCKAKLDNGADLRVNAAAGVDQQRVAVVGGPLDGDAEGLLIPADFHVGDTWAVQIVGGDVHMYRFEPSRELHHIGIREQPPAPGAPEPNDMPRQP